MSQVAAAANAAMAAQSRIGIAASLLELANPRGIFHFECRGYKPKHQREYLEELTPTLRGLIQRRDALVRRMSNAAQSELAQVLIDIASVEAYMDSLCENKWAQDAPNTVMTQGKNVMLDAALAGSSYTVTGPYMGLISSVSYSGAPAAGDTMASHSNWTEAGATNAPTYSGGRKTISWSAASGGSKSPSSAPVFTMTGSGTIKGGFVCYGSGAVSTVDNTSGSLWSGALFSGGDQAVANTNTVTVTYSTSL